MKISLVIKTGAMLACLFVVVYAMQSSKDHKTMAFWNTLLGGDGVPSNYNWCTVEGSNTGRDSAKAADTNTAGDAKVTMAGGLQLVYKNHSQVLKMHTNSAEKKSNLCEVLIVFAKSPEAEVLTKVGFLKSGEQNQLEIFETPEHKRYFQHQGKLFISQDLDAQLDRIIDIKSQGI
ncbi:MAG: hypothetical protein ACOYOK_07850 [Pseudobdellovibrionaceae bacterium]